MEGKSLATKSRWQSPSKFFPIIVDDFFSFPCKIRDYGKQLAKEKVSDKPGLRSKQLWEINPNLHNEILKKVLSCYFDLDYMNISWKLSNCSFHETPPGHGFIHQDNTVRQPGEPDNEVAGLIYLTPDIDPDAGTSLWNLKPDEIVKPQHNQSQEAHNEKFTEKLRVQNFFNRMIAYDSSEWHASNGEWIEGKDARLTLAFFIGGIEVSQFPLERTKNFEIEKLCG